MSQTQLIPVLRARWLNKYPGDRRIQLESIAIDYRGKAYCGGTIMTPISGGYDEAAGCRCIKAIVPNRSVGIFL